MDHLARHAVGKGRPEYRGPLRAFSLTPEHETDHDGTIIGRHSASQRPTASRPRTPVPKPASRPIQRAPASRRRTRRANSDVRGAASALRPPQPRPVTLAASAPPSSNAPPLRVIKCAQAIQRSSQLQRPQSRYVQAQLRCSSRASLPLTPQAGTPAATIGMRPATTLRTKTKSVNELLRAVGPPGLSYASSAATRPYRPEEALSRKRCERASSGR